MLYLAEENPTLMILNFVSILTGPHHMQMDQLSDVYERLGKQKRPVLLIWGRKDMVLPFSNSEKAKASLPNVEFHAVESGGHNLNYENPDIANPILVDFLKKQ